VRAHTYVFVVGDNGTPEHAVRPPLDPESAKGRVWELGVHVPLLVTGPGIEPGSRSRALVHTVDVFATIAELCGADVQTLGAPIDGVSFRSVWTEGDPGPRRYVFTEVFRPNGPDPERVTVAVRDDTYKLVVDRQPAGVTEGLFKLGHDWIEGDNLLSVDIPPEARAAEQGLRRELARIERSFESPDSP
jgi:arylsulfatase B